MGRWLDLCAIAAVSIDRFLIDQSMIKSFAFVSPFRHYVLTLSRSALSCSASRPPAVDASGRHASDCSKGWPSPWAAGAGAPAAAVESSSCWMREASDSMRWSRFRLIVASFPPPSAAAAMARGHPVYLCVW